MNLTPKQLKIVNFISAYRRKHGYAPTLEEMARSLGVSRVTIFEHLNALERKGVIKRRKYQSRSVELVEEELRGKELPLLGYIAAGKPIEPVEAPETLDVGSIIPPDKQCFLLRVRGDSMIDEHIRDGDYVIVEKRNTARNGETVVALINGEEATLKKFYREKNRIRLQPANPNLKPIYAKDVKILGVVIGVLRKY